MHFLLWLYAIILALATSFTNLLIFIEIEHNFYLCLFYHWHYFDTQLKVEALAEIEVATKLLKDDAEMEVPLVWIYFK
jgi:hypothetical protein